MSGSYALFRAAGFFTLLLALLLAPVVIAGESLPEKPGLSKADAHALWLGRHVLAIAEAMNRPEKPEAMAAVLALGHDSRHYVMVRGWLDGQLAADLSVQEAGRGAASPLVRARIAFLRRAIRAIDLE